MRSVSDFKELVAVVVDERNWKGIAISLFVIITIFSIIGLAIFLLTPKKSDEDWGTFRINLTDIIGYNLRPKYFNGSWVSGTKLIFQDDTGAICLIDAKNGDKHIVIDSSIVDSLHAEEKIFNKNFSSEKGKSLTFFIFCKHLKQYNIYNFYLSSDHKYILLEINTKKVINLTRLAEYKIYNISNFNMVSLSELIGDKLNKHNLLIQYACWSTVDNAMIVVIDNNIFYMPYIGSNIITISNDGKHGLIYNGVPDWLYSERINIKSTIWWSPNGQYILYAKFNDTLVDQSIIKMYGNIYETSDNLNRLSNIIEQRFPKAGKYIPTASLWIAKLENSDIKSDLLNEANTTNSFYLTYVQWITDDQLAIIWTSRDQNYSFIIICKYKYNWHCEKMAKINGHIIARAWTRISITTDPSGSYHISLPKNNNQFSRYQIANFNPNDKLMHFLTYEKYEVTKLLHETSKGTLYFQGFAQDNFHLRHIYSIKLINTVRSIDCLSCKLDHKCDKYDAVFSPTGDYYVLQCLGPRNIYSSIRQTDQNNSLVSILHENLNFMLALNDKRMPRKLFKTFITNNGATKIYIKILVPPKRKEFEFTEEEDEEELMKYPLVIESIPLEPRSLDNGYQLSWSDYLSSSKEYIYAQLVLEENRENTRDDYRTTREHLQHQLAIIDYLDENLDSLATIDRTKVAIYGSTDSAFSALTTLALDKENLLNCAIAVAPITDWRIMDSLTAEFFLGDPKSIHYNSNYDLTNLMTKTSELSGRKFLIIHGTADDKVHVQHTMLFTKALVKQKVQGTIDYQIHLYSDEDNTLSNCKLHFYQLMDSFLSKCFNSKRKFDEKEKR